MTDEQLAELIQSALDRGVEELRDQFQEKIDDVLTQFESLVQTQKDADDTLQVKIIEDFLRQNETIDNKFECYIEGISKDLLDTYNEKLDRVDNTLDTMRLEARTFVQDELLRLNDSIDRKLGALKGAKGDPGEKGDKGDSGFLSGVSKWQTGDIVKVNEAVSHDNALWLCKTVTAKEPTIGCDDWQLIVGSIKNVELVDGRLMVQMMGSDQVDLGQVSFNHCGDWKPGSYQRHDLVFLNGTTFVALKETHGRPPGNDWKALALKGQKGNRGEAGKIEMEDMVPMVRAIVEDMLGEK